MLKARQNRKHYGTIRTLLLNCVKLLDEERHPQVSMDLKKKLHFPESYIQSVLRQQGSKM